MPSVEVPEPNLNPNLVPDAVSKAPRTGGLFWCPALPQQQQSSWGPPPQQQQQQSWGGPPSGPTAPTAATRPHRSDPIAAATFGTSGFLEKMATSPGGRGQASRLEASPQPAGPDPTRPQPPGVVKQPYVLHPWKALCAILRAAGAVALGYGGGKGYSAPPPRPAPGPHGPRHTALSPPSHRPLNALGPPVRSTGVGPRPKDGSLCPIPSYSHVYDLGILATPHKGNVTHPCEPQILFRESS